MKLHATIWSGREGAAELNGKRNDLVDGGVQLEVVAFGLNRDILKRGVGPSAGVQVITDVADASDRLSCIIKVGIVSRGVYGGRGAGQSAQFDE